MQPSLVRQIKRRLSDTGHDILDVEAFWLTAETEAESYLPVFDTAAQLGARNVLVVGNDAEPTRTDNFSRLCELSHSFWAQSDARIYSILPYVDHSGRLRHCATKRLR